MKRDISLYIHIPFCKQKCLYCDFPSYGCKENLMLSYAKALSKEIDSLRDMNMKTIFIGGGTPTYLSLEAWNIIKKSIDCLKKDKETEFTVECNPGTIDKDKLSLFKSMGVNRLSIGLQAVQDEHLKQLGRIHSYKEFLDTFTLVRDFGFNNVNIDLIFGIPNQSLEQWKETLKEVTCLSPEHISCYSLIIEEGTAFYELEKLDKIILPSEDIEREMYWYTLEYLNKKGYGQYEISNFAKSNFQCRHNMVYWNLQEYIGCGSAAHSYYEGYRYSNHNKIEDYIRLINKNGDAIIDRSKNTVQADMEEFIFMGLRKIQGILLEEFSGRFHMSIYKIYGDIIEKYKNNGLLIEKEGYLALSQKGIEISNVIMSDFIQDR
ncbi:oxygen-independent coproporphyrinogen-III oxidase-like protein YqeR [Clostridium homopropionicum DSM 5847]|uniref:Heme chaperone HemW n=1 Tax=Clostridium homopropionicum DSM 5847 TaxID=1121318 RepID=A0A0L6ZE79_9CLOT|nr:radical SAM family heme chaperone HemW [Clostridium homopropionicum]KOA21247.1 oxygen-independent coproporphyrinogen-III oxidase-like protein YqeR [Clostridium homopropionicum DSM 5847]SFG28557.1 oxygen-independent coproporphyrinogen-3 oxidase [Clostridium homopropionicum]